MATITTRAGKGSPLTNTEVDANFTNLNNDKIENVVEDTTPQLGGNLDLNSNDITGTGNINVTGTVTADGLTVDGTGTVTNSVASQSAALTLQNLNTGAYGTAIDFNNNYLGTTFETASIKTLVGNQNGYLQFYTTDTGTSKRRLQLENNGDISFYEDTGATARFVWSASAEDLSITSGVAGGTFTDAEGVRGSTNGLNTQLQIYQAGGSDGGISIAAGSSGSAAVGLYANKSGTNQADFIIRQDDGTGTSKETFRITDSGNVGIGTDSPNISAGASGSTVLTVSASTANNSNRNGLLELRGTRSVTGNIVSYIRTFNNSGATPITDIRSIVGVSDTAGELTFETSGSEAIRIDSSGNVGVGESNPTFALDVKTSGGSIVNVNSTNANGGYAQFSRSGTARGFIGSAAQLISGGSNDDFAIRSTSNMLFGIGGTEAARIDSSGNLLVGTTDDNPSNNGSGGDAGVAISGTGYIAAARSDAVVALFNLMDGDGEIARFSKDGATVGSIVSNSGANLGFGSGQTGLLFYGSANNIRPANMTTNTTRDNQIDLGESGARFDDIYATNGTINTSDRNEKQDIEELSEAEQRVAVACKSLMRKFRWINSVEEKGDDARIHFGIIAQDLQAAFEAEGLDAGRYAMFIHSTWTDEETGEERSRMGVRYSELLAFIIAAI